ncbi:MAG: folate-binding protein, partial [Rhizobiaceae bacterium]
MPTVHLADRSLLHVRGADAVTFLQGLVTTDVAALAKGEARPGALLSPQGKILFSFLVLADGDTVALDCATGDAPALLKRLTLYKLRSSVELSVEDQMVNSVSWDDGPDSSHSDSTTSHGESSRFLDRSYPFAVTRSHGAGVPAATAGPEALDRLRIIHAIAEPGRDFANGEAFPHDVNLDQTGGVSFRKGCYVGQEVVSRMQHRGTARRRAV